MPLQAREPGASYPPLLPLRPVLGFFFSFYNNNSENNCETKGLYWLPGLSATRKTDVFELTSWSWIWHANKYICLEAPRSPGIYIFFICFHDQERSAAFIRIFKPVCTYPAENLVIFWPWPWSSMYVIHNSNEWEAYHPSSKDASFFSLRHIFHIWKHNRLRCEMGTKLCI